MEGFRLRDHSIFLVFPFLFLCELMEEGYYEDFAVFALHHLNASVSDRTLSVKPCQTMTKPIKYVALVSTFQ